MLNVFEASYANNIDPEQTVAVCFCANILVNNLANICSSRHGCNRLQTELKYPSKNRRRFTQRYNITKIIFS